MRPVLDSHRQSSQALKFSGRSEKHLFRNLLPNTRGRVDADTSWAYSGMGPGLSKSAFGAKIKKYGILVKVCIIHTSGIENILNFIEI